MSSSAFSTQHFKANVFTIRNDPERSGSKRAGVCHPDLNALGDIFSKLEWTVDDYPENAKITDNGSTRIITVPELDRDICSGEMVLYLPLNPGVSDVVVLQKTSIRKRHIKIYDILYKIWNFYNLRVVDSDSIQSLFASAESKDYARKLFLDHEQGLRYLRFRDFLADNSDNINFKSLDPLPGTIYPVDAQGIRKVLLTYVSTSTIGTQVGNRTR
ncbi:hypothetical protein GGF32_003817 [Allomyces javanicus]|nr:hypothetical protein GGF32_003817 [Allomyces javanicus]